MIGIKTKKKFISDGENFESSGDELGTDESEGDRLEGTIINREGGATMEKQILQHDQQHFQRGQSNRESTRSWMSSVDCLDKVINTGVGAASPGNPLNDFVNLEDRTPVKTDAAALTQSSGAAHHNLSLNPIANSSLSRSSAQRHAKDLFSAATSGRSSRADSTSGGHPGGGGGSDSFFGDFGSHFNLVQLQLRQLESKLESISNSQAEEEQHQNSRLRMENQKLSSRLHILEHRLKDLEQHSEKRTESERKELAKKSAKFDNEKCFEIENLNKKIAANQLEMQGVIADLNLQRMETNKLHDACRVVDRIANESADQIQARQDEIVSLRNSTKLEIQKIRDETASFEKNFYEQQDLETTRFIESRRQSGQANVELLNACREVEEVASKLKQDNVRLQSQINEAQAELLEATAGDSKAELIGRAGRDGSGESFEQELNWLTKDELIDRLVKEKDANFQIHNYIQMIIERVMEKNPELLEVHSWR